MTLPSFSRPFEWDEFSDQPKIILDKAFKRRRRLQCWPDLLKMYCTASMVLPISLVAAGIQPISRAPQPPNKRNLKKIFGMGVSLERGKAQFDLIAELGVMEVLVRLPLWDLENLSAYLRFIEGWRDRGCNVMVNLLQDVQTVGHKSGLEHQAREAFSALRGLVSRAQVGNAINRAKWGFYSVAEYLDFYEAFQSARDIYAPGVELCGPAVIDFEYHYTARALFNGRAIQFDRVSALLYVDRCGHPSSRQFGIFDTARKIRFLYALSAMSPKVINPGLIVTEVNWPLMGTAPYAPTSEAECVSESDYTDFMASYYHAGMATGMVETIYWHQLVAPGYGLVDNRGGRLRKRQAFDRYKSMLLNAS